LKSKNTPDFSKLSSENKVGSTNSLKIRKVNWISWELGTCQVTCSRYYFEAKSGNEVQTNFNLFGTENLPPMAVMILSKF
jgi:hypothetical protein